MRSASATALVDHLFEQPDITVGDAERVAGVTCPAARRTIDRLIELGIVEDHAGTYSEVFMARGILDAASPADGSHIFSKRAFRPISSTQSPQESYPSHLP